MLSTLLRIIPPDTLVHVMERNPKVVLDGLHKFQVYSTLGDNLSIQQQIYVSSNIDKLGDFFKTDIGKLRLANLAKEFVDYINIELTQV